MLQVCGDAELGCPTGKRLFATKPCTNNNCTIETCCVQDKVRLCVLEYLVSDLVSKRGVTTVIKNHHDARDCVRGCHSRRIVVA